MIQIDPAQILVAQFAAHPMVVANAVIRWVMVPAAVLAIGLWALVALVTRHPGEALPSEDPEPASEAAEPSLAADILAGRVPIEQTVVIERPRR